MEHIDVKLRLEDMIDEYAYERACDNSPFPDSLAMDDFTTKAIVADLYINNKKVIGYFDYTSLLVQGYDNRSYLDKLEGKDRPEYSSFYPLSCSCGEPGCNGIFEGVKSIITNTTVTWIVVDETTIKAFYDNNLLIFDRVEYDRVVKKIWRFLHNAAIENPNTSKESDEKIIELLERYKQQSPEYYKELY